MISHVKNNKQILILKIRIKACDTVIIHTQAGYGKYGMKLEWNYNKLYMYA